MGGRTEICLTKEMSSPAILIVGQGLAGTVLGWSLDRAGIDWRMIDAGHEHAASRVAAGVINPVTGQRWVKTWRVDELWPEARRFYQAIGDDLGVSLWREMKVRRYWRTDKQERVLRSKMERGVLAPYIESIDEESCVIAPVGRVDVDAMLMAARHRWLTEGRLSEGRVDWSELEACDDQLVIDCTGAAARVGPFANWDFAVSKGEVLRVSANDLKPDLILHCGHWVLPVAHEDAWLGATHEPGTDDVEPTSVALETLLATAEKLTGEQFTPKAHLVGLRLASRDMHPVVGRHPNHPKRGILSALGSKGVLYAPWLAQQWVEHIIDGEDFDPTVVISRASARKG
jgi:glycine/D-amino acid oxidase-like deaminating enzyme